MNYLYLLEKNFNEVKPMYLSNDLSLATVVGKLIGYINDLYGRDAILSQNFDSLKTTTDEKISENTKSVNDFVTSQTEKYNTLEQELLANLNTYKENTDRVILEKSNEVDNALNNIDLTDAVSDYFASQLTTDYFKNLYEQTKTYVYALAYYGPNPTITGNFYWYNTTTDKLYYNGTEIDIYMGSIYLAEGHIYVAVKSGDTYVLREAVLANG